MKTVQVGDRKFSLDIPSEKIQILETVEDAVNYLNSERKEKIYVITCFSDKDKFLTRVSVD